MKNAIFSAVQPVLGQSARYDYVHLDSLSDISAYRTVVKQQRTAMTNANVVKYTYSLKSFILSALCKSLYVYDSVVNSILIRTVKIRKL